ncbi:MAG TPA: ParA family protein [Actinomycetota bacterium]|nr:ParA family protein [Actinomycetota bacterium]
MSATQGDDQPPAGRVVAVANQKGGVGKTTTAVNLGAALAERGSRILVVDLDPQGNASTGMGLEPDARMNSTYDVLMQMVPAADAVVATAVEGLFAIPATVDLAGADVELVDQPEREGQLGRAIADVVGQFDFVLIDCPPSLGLLTVNALAAAPEILVPIQCEYYALEGLGHLLKNLRLVQQNINPQLRLNGIVMTMFDSRTRLADQVVAEVRAHFGPAVYESIIPRTVRLSEAPGFGQPITRYDSGSKGALAYRHLAEEFAKRPIADHGSGLGRLSSEQPSGPARAVSWETAGPSAQDDRWEGSPVMAVPASERSGPRLGPTPEPGAGSEPSLIQRPDPAEDPAPRPRRWWPFRRTRGGGS